MKLFRFKSNPQTIVHFISPTLVQIVWSRSFDFGGNQSFCYGQHSMDNLIPLTPVECEEIIAKRKARNLDLNIGTLAPTFS